MTDVILPEMNLDLPTVLVSPGPQYAEIINEDLEIINLHDHTTGKGVQIPTAGINIDDDLSINNNHIQSIIGARFHNNNNTLVGTDDKNEIYVFNGDLYYNNAIGTPVRITNASEIVQNTSSFILQSINANFVVNPSLSYNFFEVSTGGGAVSITLPAASSVQSGRPYYIKDVAGVAGFNHITLVRNGSDTFDGIAANRVLDTSLGMWVIISDHVSNWIVGYFSNKLFADGTFGTFSQNTILQGSTVAINANGSNQISVGSGTNVVTIGGDSANIGSTTRLDIISPLTHIDSTTIRIGGAANSAVDIGNTGGGGANTMQAPTFFNDTLTANHLSTFRDNVIIGTNSSNTLTINSTTSVLNPFNITGGILNVDVAVTSELLGNVILGTGSGQTVQILGTTSFNAPTTFVSTATFDNAVTFISTAPINLQSVILANGIGRKTSRVRYDNGDSDSSFGAGSYDYVFATGITAARTYTLTHTGSILGDVIVIGTGKMASSFVLNINDVTSGLIVSWLTSTTLDAITHIFYFGGSNWHLIG